ncbi:glycosyltransferase family 4 protein [soil metagenome]
MGSGLRGRAWWRREKVDVLHFHTPVASMLGRLAGWRAGVQMIVYTAHGFYFHDRMTKKKYRRHVMLERFFSRFQDAMFCVSREDVETAKKLRIGKPSRTFYIGNGVDTERFKPAGALRGAREGMRDELGIPRNAIVVAMMGRLVREKGYREFFAAARVLAPKHSRLQFLIVGDAVVSEHDNAKEEIVSMARAPELKDRVHFTGMRRDIPELLAASDIFALPSYREGMPVSVLEAMAAGLPVVATRIRGCREAVADGGTGFLVEPQNAAELTDAIEYLIAHPDDAARLGATGHERAVEHFAEARVLDHEIALYRQLLGKSRR